jgi:hypothetical protein
MRGRWELGIDKKVQYRSMGTFNFDAESLMMMLLEVCRYLLVYTSYESI